MKRLLSVAVAIIMIATIFGSGLAISAMRPGHVVVLLDASSSNPMVMNADHARRVAGDVVEKIGELAMRDRITLSTLGVYDVIQHPILELEVNTKFPPNVAMSWIGQRVALFPDEVKQLPGGVQGSTHILGSLEMMARRVSCGDHRVRFFILTDGQENGQALSEAPEPLFQGCDEMTMIGVVGATPSETKALGDAWMKWCAAAGFSRCDYRS